jgi:hypothetical protein
METGLGHLESRGGENTLENKVLVRLGFGGRRRLINPIKKTLIFRANFFFRIRFYGANQAIEKSPKMLCLYGGRNARTTTGSRGSDFRHFRWVEYQIVDWCVLLGAETRGWVGAAKVALGKLVVSFVRKRVAFI